MNYCSRKYEKFEGIGNQTRLATYLRHQVYEAHNGETFKKQPNMVLTSQHLKIFPDREEKEKRWPGISEFNGFSDILFEQPQKGQEVIQIKGKAEQTNLLESQGLMRRFVDGSRKLV